MIWSERYGLRLLWILFLLPLGLLLGSLFWQFVLGDQPCALCVIQRILLMLLTGLGALFLSKASLRNQWWMSVIAILLVIAAQAANVWQILLPSHGSQDLPSGICAVQLGDADNAWLSALFSTQGSCQDGMVVLLGIPALYWIALSLLLLLVLHISYWYGIRQAKQSQSRLEEKKPDQKNDPDRNSDLKLG